MERNGDTSIRVSKATKKRFRKIVTERGIPESVSDDDAIAVLCGWVESMVPPKSHGA